MAIISKNLLKNTFSPSASLFSEYSEFDFFDLFSFTFQSFLPAFFLWPQSWDPIFCQKRKDLLSTKIEFFTTFGFYRLEHFSPPHLIIPWNNLYSNSQNSIPFKKTKCVWNEAVWSKEWLYKNLIWMRSPKKSSPFSLGLENNNNYNTNSNCTHTYKKYTKIYHSTFSDPPLQFQIFKRQKTIFCTKACLWQKFEKTELWLRPEVMLLQQQIKVKEKWYEF